jgi:hypothetical protein
VLKTIAPACEKVFVLSKRSSITPSLWLSFKNPQTILWKKENTSDTTRSYILSSLLWLLGQGSEWGDPMVNEA